MNEEDAAHALAMMRTARNALGQRARWSFARHAAVGLLFGGLIAGYALPAPWPLAVVAASMIATLLIVAQDRRRDGFFVNGYRRGRTRWVTLALLLIALGALAGAVTLKSRFGLLWAPLAIGGATAILATLASIAWERVYRCELEGAGHDR